MDVFEFQRKFLSGTLGNKKKYGPYYIIETGDIQLLMAYSRADDTPYVCAVRDSSGMVVCTNAQVSQSRKPGSRKRAEKGYDVPRAQADWSANFASLEAQCGGNFSDWAVLKTEAHRVGDRQVIASLFTVGNNYYLADIAPGSVYNLSATQYAAGDSWGRLNEFRPQPITKLPVAAFSFEEARASLLPAHIRGTDKSLIRDDYHYLPVTHPDGNAVIDFKGLELTSRVVSELTQKKRRVVARADLINGEKLDPDQWYDICRNTQLRWRVI